MLKRISLLLLFTLAASLPSPAQSDRTLALPGPKQSLPAPAPGNMQLLEGYTHTRSLGIDSAIGKISKPGELTIGYDIGEMAGLYADECETKGACLWFKRQVINGREVRLGLMKDGRVIATFPKEYANFYARTKSHEELADFLLMVLTFKVNQAAPAKAPPAEPWPKEN